MKLEEAKRFLNKKIEVNNAVVKEAQKSGDINLIELTNNIDTESSAIETALQALENSVSKDLIREQIERLNKEAIMRKNDMLFLSMIEREKLMLLSLL